MTFAVSSATQFWTRLVSGSFNLFWSAANLERKERNVNDAIDQFGVCNYVTKPIIPLAQSVSVKTVEHNQW